MPKQKAVWLLVLLLAGQVMLPAQGARPENSPPPEKGPLRKALERSLLFPGLGQLGEKQYVKAALFGGAEIFCLVQVLIFMGKGNDAYKKYRDATDPAGRDRIPPARRKNMTAGAIPPSWPRPGSGC